MPKGIEGPPAETIYDPTEVAAIKAMRRTRGPGAEGTLLDRLAAGEVLWFPDRRRVSGTRAAMAGRGYAMQTRRAVRDGVPGLYAWAEKRAPQSGDDR